MSIYKSNGKLVFIEDGEYRELCQTMGFKIRYSWWHKLKRKLKRNVGGRK